ncbi:chain-length determining protein [uncultured Anaerococcus sp.]|uniref:chain-length determining protein n=1 Tax=uncultured Anaerococcus sp. TaxID=293428 RepID=UPI00280C1C99|nr:chain-length determining protein [uncultured Anaerococcus sp.]MDU5150098.1 chain-length determining protein [Anaerococcus prevotii]
MKEKRSLFSAIPLGLICGIVAAVLFYFALSYSNFNEYKAKSKIITTSLEEVEKDTDESSIYAATINSNKIKKAVLDNLGIDMSLGILDTKLSIDPIEKSPIIDIVVVDTNKQRAEDLADEYADLSVRVINNIYGKDAQVMEYSYQAAGRVNNGYIYAAIVGAAVFILVSLINMIRINSYNNKVLAANYRMPEEVAKDDRVTFKKDENEYDKEVLDNSYDEEEFKEVSPEDEIEEYQTSKIDIVDDEEDDDYGETTVIDSSEVLSSVGYEESNQNEEADEKESYPILGKLPPYTRGELDV